MSWSDKIKTSIHGRRFGIDRNSTGVSGGTYEHDLLVGPEDVRRGVTTANTTSANVRPFGVQVLPGTSAGSSSVYTLDPPIPGVRVTIRGSTQAATYLKTANSETIVSTQSSSGTVIAGSSAGGTFELIGYTTAQWLGVNLTSGTSSQSGTFIVSTST